MKESLKDSPCFENKYCRMCAFELKQGVFIFGEEGKRLQIAEKIRKTMSILIFEEDTLPKKICMDCCSQLESFAQYKENCLIAQEKLQSIVVSLEKAQEKMNNSPTKATISVPLMNESTQLVNERVDEIGRLKMKACTNNLRIRCGFCRDAFENHEDLKSHQDNLHEKSKHREPYIECIECQRKFNGFESLYCHYEKSYRFNPPDEFPLLNKMFTSSIDDSEPVNMRIIEKRSPTKNSPQKAHMSPSRENLDSDSDTRGAIEDDCVNLIVEEPEVTKQTKAKRGKKDSIIYPKREISQKKPKNDGIFKCDICDKVLATANGLQGHIDIHKGKRFNCDMCDATYSQKSSLVHHKNVHHLMISKKHKCPECGKDFFELKHLNEHLKLHNTPSPEFACSVCKKTFSTGRLLRRHSRYHNGVKPFKCRFCGKAFLVKSKCGEHENSHTDKRPFGCSFCEKGFNSHANYLKHVRRKHPEHVSEDKKCPPPKKSNAASSSSSSTNITIGTSGTTISTSSSNNSNNINKAHQEENYETSTLTIGINSSSDHSNQYNSNWNDQNQGSNANNLNSQTLQHVQTAPENLHQENHNNMSSNSFHHPHHQSHHQTNGTQSGHQHSQQGNYHQSNHPHNSNIMNSHCSQNAHQQTSRHASLLSMSQHGQSIQGMKMGSFHNALDLMDSTIQNALTNGEDEHLAPSASQSEPMELSYKLDEGFQEMPMELTKVFQRDPLELCVRQEFAPLIDLSSRVGLTLTNDTHMGLGINVHKLDMTERELMDMSGAFRQPIDLRNEEVSEICNEGNLVDLSLRSSFVQDHSASSFLRELIDLSARSDTFHGELNLTNKHQQGHNHQSSNANQSNNLSFQHQQQQQQQHLPRTSTASISSLQNIIYHDTLFTIQN